MVDYGSYYELKILPTGEKCRLNNQSKIIEFASFFSLRKMLNHTECCKELAYFFGSICLIAGRLFVREEMGKNWKEWSKMEQCVETTR